MDSTQCHRVSTAYPDVFSQKGYTGDILDPENSLKRPSSITRPLSTEHQLSTNGDYEGDRGQQRKLPSRSEKRPEVDERRGSVYEHKKEYGDDLIHQRGNPWTTDKETILMAPFDYLDAHPGKDVRSQLIAAFNAWLRVPTESLAVITKVVGMLHTASLLVDDVEDSSRLRRGVPVAHNIFGTAQTINTANYVYFLALQELQKLQNPSAINIYTEELLNLHRGQGLDLFWRDSLTCPTEREYLEMVGNKTGGLFRLAVKLMQAESSSDIDCVPLVNTVGLLFQILDDYKNLASKTYTVNKGLAEDLEEGKFSFPVIHSIRADPTSLVLINILKQKPKDVDVKKYAISYMEKTGSFAYTREILKNLEERAIQLIDQMERSNGSEVVGYGVRAILTKMRVEDPTTADVIVPYPPTVEAGSKEG